MRLFSTVLITFILAWAGGYMVGSNRWNYTVIEATYPINGASTWVVKPGQFCHLASSGDEFFMDCRSLNDSH